MGIEAPGELPPTVLAANRIHGALAAVGMHLPRCSDWLRGSPSASRSGQPPGPVEDLPQLGRATMLLGGLWHGRWMELHHLGGVARCLPLGAPRLVRRAQGRGGPADDRDGMGGAAGLDLPDLPPGLPAGVGFCTGAWPRPQPGRISAACSARLPAGYPVVLQGTSALFLLLIDVPSWYRDDEQPFSPRWPAAVRGGAYGLILSICVWVGFRV